MKNEQEFNVPTKENITINPKQKYISCLEAHGLQLPFAAE